MPSFENPNSYLQSHLEPQKAEVKEALPPIPAQAEEKQNFLSRFVERRRVQEVFRAREEYERLYEGETVIFQEGDVTIEAAFEEIDLATISQKLQKELYGFGGGRDDAIHIGWREMKKYTTRNAEGECVDVMQLLPFGTRIFYTHRFEGMPSKSNVEENAVAFHGDLRKPEVFLICLHEIGHLYGAKTTPEQQTDALSTLLPVNPEAAAAFLESERDAWAFAIKTAKKLMRQDGWMTPEILKTYPHGDGALANYSEKLWRHVITDTGE